MANDDGTFGFEDLQKAFNRIEQKYENKTDAMLMAMANTARQRVRSKTPTGKTKKLKGSWRTKKPKTFGKARVARVQTENRYGHVVEEGHIDSDEGRKALVHADAGDIEERGRNGRARLNVIYKSQPVNDLPEGRERVVAANGVGAFVGVVEVKALEHLLHARQF